MGYVNFWVVWYMANNFRSSCYFFLTARKKKQMIMMIHVIEQLILYYSECVSYELYHSYYVRKYFLYSSRANQLKTEIYLEVMRGRMSYMRH